MTGACGCRLAARPPAPLARLLCRLNTWYIRFKTELSQLNNFELVPLSRGKYLLRVGDNTFSTNEKDLSGISTWYCSKRISRKCRASVKMLGRDIVHINGDHSH
ncbi:FLYWCH zinc finger domain-containing protein [Phthorimaea operculella]|nr:FLYWCH zinc finger domain-containing protein [Phthorimaea operculella]